MFNSFSDGATAILVKKEKIKKNNIFFIQMDLEKMI